MRGEVARLKKAIQRKVKLRRAEEGERDQIPIKSQTKYCISEEKRSDILKLTVNLERGKRKTNFKIFSVCFWRIRVQGIITVGERGSLFLSLLFFGGFLRPREGHKTGRQVAESESRLEYGLPDRDIPPSSTLDFFPKNVTG